MEDACKSEGMARPAGYPAELERDVRIRTGATVHLRPIRPDDAGGLIAFHSRLSPRTVYMRFFTFHPVLTTREVERFTQVDYVDRLALVVEAAGRIVGVGRYDRLAGTDEAEVAFIVDDEYQHRGLGTLLADELARAAWTQGITVFVADTLAENSGMLEVFHGIGFPVKSSFDEGVVRIRFPIEPTGPYAEALRRREEGRAGGGSRRQHEVTGSGMAEG
jgi:GNAT superfamily N-acetyltransferase